jgi:hypothetical protein
MKIKTLLYCCKNGEQLIKGFAKPMHTKDTTNPFNYNWCLVKKSINSLNGKIACECEVDTEEFSYMRFECLTHTYLDLLKHSCLTDKQMYDYLRGKNGYALHLSNIKVFDKPRELSDYCRITK